MNSLLYGNGLDIQYGGTDYTNYNIKKRAIEKLSSGNFPKEIYSDEAIECIEAFNNELIDIINGKYDKYAYFPSEKEALSDLQKRYKGKSVDPSYVGFEDYFLVMRLVCNKFKLNRDIRKGAFDGLRAMYLDSIFNNGKIQTIYLKFPDSLVTYFKSFDKIFTTNYDNNVERATGKTVYYLHGGFHILQDVYNPNSLRNHLSDSPIKNAKIISGYEHLYSNSLTDFSGNLKKFFAQMGQNANIAATKFANGMSNPKIRNDVYSWKDSDNALLRNLYESIIIKTKNPDLKFSEYPIKEFLDIKGQITIIGLSPTNDKHLFEFINENKDINAIKYYFFDKDECEAVKDIIHCKAIDFLDVNELWASMT